MKLIIFEGPDRVGKDTLINLLVSQMPNVIKRHWVSPQGNTNKEKIEFQKKTFKREFKLFSDLNESIPDSHMIWNRAHLGEMVYGTLYRNYSPNWIWDLEFKYDFGINPEIYLIYLYADPEFLVNHDDGKSFTNDIQSKRKELELFDHAFAHTNIIKKIKVKVNDKNEYLPVEQTLKQINRFIYESN